MELIEFMEQLSPFGMGNPRPNILLSPSAISSNERFIKVIDTNNRTWHGFIQGQCTVPRNGPVRIVATPVLREQRGEQFIRLNIKDILPIENQA
jgi:hypothetical protein